MEGRFEADGDNWEDAVVVDVNDLPAIRLAAPFCPSHVITHSVDELLDDVLSDVGANRPELDQVDQRIVANVRHRDTSFKGSRTGLPGIIDSQRDVGGWPQLRSGVAPVDTDHDGLPDAWELAHGLDPYQPDQNTRLSPVSVTALETYLSELCTVPAQQ
jgi:hypothetical protein